MACVRYCPYCGRMTCSPWHPECRQEFMEDLLAQVKLTIKAGCVLPKTLAKKIKAEKFRTKREFERLRRAEANRQIKKQFRDLARLEVMQRAAEEFDQKNPDPNAPTYAGKIN